MLTPKKRLFAKAYLATPDLNATQAAIEAGYSKKTAHSQGPRLLEDVGVRALIQEGMDKRAAKLDISADYVLSTIHETIERCKQVKPVINRKGEHVRCEDRDGNMVPAYAFDANAVLKGSELLGKHLKLFTEKHEHAGKDGGKIEQDLTIRWADE